MPPSRPRNKWRAPRLRAWECRLQDQSAKRDGLAKIRSFSHTIVTAHDPAHLCAACVSLALASLLLLPPPRHTRTGAHAETSQKPDSQGAQASRDRLTKRKTEGPAPTSGRSSQSRLDRVKYAGGPLTAGTGDRSDIHPIHPWLTAGAGLRRPAHAPHGSPGPRASRGTAHRERPLASGRADIPSREGGRSSGTGRERKRSGGQGRERSRPARPLR